MWLKTADSSTACETSTLKSPLLLGSDAPHVHPRLRKRPPRCTLDCGFKTSESPALRGFVGERGRFATTSLYLVLKSNGLRHSKNLPVKFGFSSKTVPANIAKKLPPQRCFKPLLIPFFNFSHKWPTFALTPESGYTLAFRRKIAHNGSHAETGAFLPSATAWLCAASEIHFIPPCFYIHTFPGSLWTTTISNSSISDHLSSRFSASRTNGPRSLSQAKAGTRSAPLKKSHTTAHTPKQGAFWVGGWYHYSRSVPHVSETLRGQGVERQTLPFLGLGRVCSRRTQRACGTAMRLCASLFRGIAAPLGCVALLPLFVQHDLLGWKDLTKRSGRVTITRNNRTASRLALVWEPRWAVK